MTHIYQQLMCLVLMFAGWGSHVRWFAFELVAARMVSIDARHMSWRTQPPNVPFPNNQKH